MLELLTHHFVERQLQQQHAAQLKDVLADAKLPVLRSASHIVPVIVGSAALCKRVTGTLPARPS